MKLAAILKDSFRETLDSKTFHVLMGVSALLAFACFSLSFPRLPLEHALDQNLSPERIPFPARVSECTLLEGGRATPRGRYRFVMEPMHPEYFASELADGVAERARARLLAERMATGETTNDVPRREADRPEPPRTAAQWRGLIEPCLGSIPGLERPAVVALDTEDEKPPRRVEVVADIDWDQLGHARQVGFLFGLVKLDLGPDTFRGTVYNYQMLLVGWIAGSAGILVAVVVTGGFVPSMLRPGTAEFVLVRPISRPRLLLYKYLGGLLFVSFVAVVLVGGTWVAFGCAVGNWSPWYLLTMLVLLYYFAILYSVSVLAGVLTRSQVAAVLVTLGAWLVLVLIGNAYSYLHLPSWEGKTHAILLAAVDVAHFLLPKPSDLSGLEQTLLLRANHLPDDFRPYMQALRARSSWVETLSTSTLFVGSLLGAACWRFRRMDF